MVKKKTCVFISGHGSNLKNLIKQSRNSNFPIKISFEICSKQLLTMRNRFLILPKPEKLNFNEFLRFKVLKTDENIIFPKDVENRFCNMLSYVKKCGENGYTISFEPTLPKWHVFAKIHFWHFCTFSYRISFSF